MKLVGYIFLGIVIGVAVTLVAVFIFIAIFQRPPVHDNTLESLDKEMDKQIESLLYEEPVYEEPVDTNYFNIETKKGRVVLFTGMTKDSIISLLGEPHSFRASSSLGTEHMRYDVEGGVVGNLSLTLEKGKLTELLKY